MSPKAVGAVAIAILLVTAPIASASAVPPVDRSHQSTAGEDLRATAFDSRAGPMSSWQADRAGGGPQKTAGDRGAGAGSKKSTDRTSGTEEKDGNSGAQAGRADGDEPRDGGGEVQTTAGVSTSQEETHDERQAGDRNREGGGNRESWRNQETDRNRGQTDGDGEANVDRREAGRPAGAPTATPTTPGQQSAGYPAPPLDRSALAFRRTAIERLHGTDLGPGSGQRERHLANLERGETHHIDPNRIDSGAVFDPDRQVAAATTGRAPNVTGAVVAADAVVAHTAVSDAERVAAELRRRNLSFDEGNVSDQLAEARAALERGDTLRGQSPAAATHYRRAWAHAQRAIDLMDEAVAPQVSIETRWDLPHNGTVSHPVNGTVFDVRGYELNATLSVNDTVERPLPLSVNTTPGAVARFNASVDLLRQWPGTENRTYEVNVSSRDPGVDYAPTASDEFEEIHGPQKGLDPLRLDGDGLPDRYESAVTGTDPLHADSDSALTGANESRNGAIDGAEDLDGESVNNYREYLEGLDPLDSDTDGDDLTDAFELRYQGADPRESDTDDDGTPDGAEDLDDDGLSNRREQAASTSPVRSDTDRDGLDDGAEVDEHGTDPLTPDTDGDGLSDAAELFDLGTDPLAADTDGDGTRDGEETHTTTAESEALGASVAVTGEGNVAGAVTVANGSREQFDAPGPNDARASPFVRFESDREFDTATVAIRYEESRVAGAESDLRIYRFNESIGTFEPVDSTVDSANDTVRAETSHFSTYVVFSASTWESYFEEPLPETHSRRIDRFDRSNVSCEGSGDCGVEDGAITVGETGSSASTSGFASVQLVFGDEDDCLSFGCEDEYDSGGSSDDSDTGGFDPIEDCLGFGCEDEYGSGIGDDDDGDDFDDGGDSAPVDSDGDGVNDGEDDCPDESGTSATGGCPDRDGDGTRNSQDACPDDPETAAEPCFIATATGPTLQLPAGAEEIQIQMDVEADVPNSDAYVEVWLAGESATETVYSEHSVGGTGFGSDTVSADVSEFAGESVTVLVEKAGDASASVEDVRLTVDSDGDGLTDNEERRGLRTGYATTVSTSPYEADTDGDGLGDSEEVSHRYSDYYSLRSDPTDADTDGDGLDDYEERRVWESDPQSVDSDEDGIDDFPDPRINVRDQPPKITDVSTQNAKKYVEVQVTDDAAVEVRANPQYAPDSPLEDPYWDPSKATVIDQGAGAYRIEFEDHGLLNEPPERYWVNVTDSHGNGRVVLINVGESGVATIAAAGVAVGSTASLPTPDPFPEEVVRVPAGILLASVSGAALYVSNEYISADQSVARQELLTAAVANFKASETALDSDVRLVAGGVESAYDPRVGETIHHGHGWEYIQATSDVTKEEIEYVLSHNPAVTHRGDRTIVIGQNAEEEEIILTIIGGFLMAASAESPVFNEECGDTVHISEGDNPGHSLREGKPIDEVTTLRDIIRNPSRIVDAGPQRFYIKKLGPGRVIVIATDTVTETFHILRTTLTGNSPDNAYKTIKKAIDDIPNNDREIVYDPENNIDC